jgi:aquaporin Z
MNYNNIIAEYFGTLLLVLSIFASGGNALFIGLTLSAILYVSGKNNPGNINPAVSLGMYFKGKLSLQELIGFIVAQLLGGISSVYIFKALA